MAAPIFVAGGTGMVGRNVCDLAAARGLDVVAPRHGELDLLDGGAVRAYLARLRPSVVVHAAGRVGGIEANMREPVRFLTENCDMGKNVVLAAREAGVERLINLGSSCMYPKDSPRLLTEDDILSGPLEPTNEAYAIAKSAVQRLCAYIASETPDFRYKTLIPCNLYGRYDTFDPKRSHLAAAVIHKLHRAKVEGRETVEIWGDGTVRREFLYAGDLADAVLAVIERYDSAAGRHECRRRRRSHGQRVLRGRGRGRRLHRHVRPRSVEAGRHEAEADGCQPRRRLGLDRPHAAEGGAGRGLRILSRRSRCHRIHLIRRHGSLVAEKALDNRQRRQEDFRNMAGRIGEILRLAALGALVALIGRLHAGRRPAARQRPARCFRPRR